MARQHKVKVVRAITGLGKTAASLTELLRRFPHSAFVFVGPTKRLVKEAISTFERETGHKAAPLFGIDEHECPRKAEIKERMSRGLRYRAEICSPCAHRSSCSFHAQREESRQSPYVFTTVDHVISNPKFWLHHRPDVVILDEDVYRKLMRRVWISEDDPTRFRRSFENAPSDLKAKLEALVARIDHAFETHRDLHAGALWDGIDLTAEDVRIYNDILAHSKRNALDLLPQLRRAKRQGCVLRHRKGYLLGHLRVFLPKRPLYYVLDATADIKLVSLFLGSEVEEVTIAGDIPPQALFIQCTSSSFSKDTLGKLRTRDELHEHIERFIDDCRAHGRRPALGVRPSMVRPTKPDEKNDDYLLVDALREKYKIKVVTSNLDPSSVGDDDLLVVTYGTERGINVVHDLGVTDIMIVGCLSPKNRDLLDVVRFLYPTIRAKDKDLLKFDLRRQCKARTRLGFDWMWQSVGYVHPLMRRVYQQFAVTRIVQLAERIRSIIPPKDHRIKKRIFLLTTEDLTPWFDLDWIGEAEQMHQTFFAQPSPDQEGALKELDYKRAISLNSQN